VVLVQADVLLVLFPREMLIMRSTLILALAVVLVQVHVHLVQFLKVNVTQVGTVFGDFPGQSFLYF
jgi:hypothetical protein